MENTHEVGVIRTSLTDSGNNLLLINVKLYAQMEARAQAPQTRGKFIRTYINGS